MRHPISNPQNREERRLKLNKGLDLCLNLNILLFLQLFKNLQGFSCLLSLFFPASSPLCAMVVRVPIPIKFLFFLHKWHELCPSLRRNKYSEKRKSNWLSQLIYSWEQRYWIGCTSQVVGDILVVMPHISESRACFIGNEWARIFNTIFRAFLLASMTQLHLLDWFNLYQYQHLFGLIFRWIS